MDAEYGYWCGNLSPSKITTYFVPVKKPNRRSYNDFFASITPDSADTWQSNFAKKGHTQKLGQSARKKISNSIDWMYYMAEPKKIYNFKTKTHFTFLLSFFTATLSSKQIHDDNTIKRDILRPFLDYLRKNYNIDRYIWRLEKQKNGSSHFHIVLDKYIPFFILRRKWNYYQNKLGYVNRYMKEQFNWHIHGFKPREWLYDSWPLESQRRAYIEGCEDGYQNPNSTDIHSLKGIKDVISYISKYITKTDCNETTTENKSVSPIIEDVADYGRVWALSQSLSQIRNPTFDIDGKKSDELNKIKTWNKTKIVISDYYQIIYCHSKYWKRLDCEELFNLLQMYVQAEFG